MSKPPSSLFGRRLRAARVKAGIPQDRLGVMIGIDEGAASARMSRYESGVHEPSFRTAEDIARVLGIPTAYLFCEDDELADVIIGWSSLTKADKKHLFDRFFT